MEYTQEEKKTKVEPSKIWKDYQNATNYKNGENIYNITRRNERYYAGDQWKGIKTGDLTTQVYNFLEQLIDVKVSTLMSNKLTTNRRPDENDSEDGRESQFAKAFAAMDKKNWERLKMDMLNEEMLLKSALSGLGGTYWFWDDDIITGNTFKTKGDFKAETIDAVDLYVSNPNDENIQTQDWIILSFRKTVAQVKEMARKLKLSENEIATIQCDEDTSNEGYDKATYEQDNDKNNNTTLLLKLWKEDGKVYFCKSTKDVVLVDKEDTMLKRYPIAIMNWKKRQKFILGTGEITYIISNQQSANKLMALRDLSAMLMSVPKIVYNKNSISGITNQAGGTYGVDITAGSPVQGLIQYLQPTATSIDIDKSIESNINLTKQLKGINDNVVGAARAENTSAIIAQQRAAGVPLESIKRRFWQYIEDVALIWLDFYQHKYNMTRQIKDEEGNVYKFTGTEAEDIYLNTSIDVGESSNWSEPIAVGVLDNLLASKDISIVQYLERFPKNIIPESDRLIEEKKKELGIDEESMKNKNFMTSLPQEVQQILSQQPNGEQLAQELMQMPPEQQQQAIQQLMAR